MGKGMTLIPSSSRRDLGISAAESIDIFYAAGKLTDEHYAELTGMLAEKKEQV